ncbi:MAG: 23S rRNA (adenine(2503)-C(2))-methyltransferase RlmN [Bacteroidota bacterium]
MQKDSLLGKTIEELRNISTELDKPIFLGNQLAHWLYKSNVPGYEGMNNISKVNRAMLAERYLTGLQSPEKVQESKDGTKKYLFRVSGNRFVEAAYIPEKDRATLCLSTQVGCKMGCLFCNTGKQGFQGNLSAGEIINQYRMLPEREKITNIVYMGMGEPLDNYEHVKKSLEIFTSTWGFGMSPRRITVSTIGILPATRDFILDNECHLAVSLHTPFNEERKKIMPVETVSPIQEVVEEIKNHDFGGQRRVSFEYIMFENFNDTQAHAKQVAKLLNGLKCRINLIRYHQIPGISMKGSSPEKIQAFKDQLNQKKILTTIRASRGEDILAACGLLSTRC